MNQHRRGEVESAIGLLVLIVFGLFILAGGIGGCMYVVPRYNVYEQEMAGQAELQRAESTRRVAVLEAQAKMDAAKMLAEAEVERAGGVARANKIIGDSLKGNESYLRYLWIDKLDMTKAPVIYVPTESGIPILEAGRRPESEAR